MNMGFQNIDVPDDSSGVLVMIHPNDTDIYEDASVSYLVMVAFDRYPNYTEGDGWDYDCYAIIPGCKYGQTQIQHAKHSNPSNSSSKHSINNRMYIRL